MKKNLKNGKEKKKLLCTCSSLNSCTEYKSQLISKFNQKLRHETKNIYIEITITTSQLQLEIGNNLVKIHNTRILHNL